jgi:cob(I)alamin adenosyltransferase
LLGIHVAERKLGPGQHRLREARAQHPLRTARTVCRRAERGVVRLARSEAVDPVVVKYLNRLSDLLFTLARLENHRAGQPDREWRKGEGPQ